MLIFNPKKGLQIIIIEDLHLTKNNMKMFF